jgi:hypothetical protein
MTTSKPIGISLPKELIQKIDKDKTFHEANIFYE